MADPAPSITVRLDAAGGFEIRLPADPKPVLGKTRAPVVVEINGYRYRSTVAAMGGGWFVPFRASHREASGIVPGAAYDVVLTLDTEPRVVAMPADLAAAIDAAGVRAAWDRLSYTNQREHADAVESAKKPDTRARRIAACVDRLREK